jgi:hypothetical protein
VRCWRSAPYKGAANAAVRHGLVEQLTIRAPWLRLGDFEQVCRQSDHALDAVIAALNVRAAALGQTTAPTAEQAAAARTEGWIALPTADLNDLSRPTDTHYRHRATARRGAAWVPSSVSSLI